MNDFIVKKAQPISKKILMGLIAPSSGGKTASALRIATGIASKMNGKIALIDTENERSADYAGRFDFHIIPFAPPYTGERYLAAIKAAEAWGADVIIVDSFSHEHEGEGGVLEQHEAYLDAKCGSNYTKRNNMSMVAWNEAKKGRKKIILELQKNNTHMILCFRAKKKMKLVKNAEGKTEPVDIGFQIIGAEEFGYEIKIAAYLPPNSQGKPDWEHENARINDMDGDLKKYLSSVTQLNENVGAKLYDMLSQKSEPQKPQYTPEQLADAAEKAANKLLTHIEHIAEVEHIITFLTANQPNIDRLEKYPDLHKKVNDALQTKQAELNGVNKNVE